MHPCRIIFYSHLKKTTDRLSDTPRLRFFLFKHVRKYLGIVHHNLNGSKSSQWFKLISDCNHTAWICLVLYHIEWSTKSMCHNIRTKGYYNILLISDFSAKIAYINTWFQQVALQKIPQENTHRCRSFVSHHWFVRAHHPAPPMHQPTQIISSDQA